MSSSQKYEFEESIQVINRSQMKTFKVVIVGSQGVGKTCLTYRFCERKFPKNVEATIGLDFREKIVNIEGESIKMQLWDTAGMERFRKSMIHHYYRNAKAVIFVYDMTKPLTFTELNNWIEECTEHNLKPEDVPRILVGTKCDAKEDISIVRSAALRFADMHQMPLFETSALLDAEQDTVDSIFITLAYKLKNSKPMMVSMPSQAHDCIKLEQKSTTDNNNAGCCGC